MKNERFDKPCGAAGEDEGGGGAEFGFGVATNVVTLITKDGIKELPLMGKDEVAGCLLDEIAARRGSYRNPAYFFVSWLTREK